jgi:hypothetical protein
MRVREFASHNSPYRGTQLMPLIINSVMGRAIRTERFDVVWESTEGFDMVWESR